jgi:hypothetical protein
MIYPRRALLMHWRRLATRRSQPIMLLEDDQVVAL